MTSSDTGQCPSSYFILENSNSLANAFTKTNLGYVNITITGNQHNNDDEGPHPGPEM